MESNVLNNEPIIRLSCFCGIFLIISLWEILAPRRNLSLSKRMRWLNNLGLVALNTIVLRVIFPASAVSIAIVADRNSWGLLNNLDLANWQVVLLSIIGLDLAIYLQHVMFHALPSLWRLHKIHHGDRDFDVSTGLRFHPLEILLSMVIKIAAIVLLGTPVLAVVLFEILLNGTSMFNHGNILLPQQLDRRLRWFLVTPDMHRIHHSIIECETNSNFGFNLPWWDYLFGTYRHNSLITQEKMSIGLQEYQENLKVQKLHWILLLPFISNQDNYSIIKRDRTNTISQK